MKLEWNKLTKISSQPIFKRYKARKASYLGYLKASQNNIPKSKLSKPANINNQKMISKLLKNDKIRENSSSAQSFYTEKHPVNKLGKSKAGINQKFTSRNSENPSATEFSITNTNSFSNNLITFKRQRPSVDVVKGIISNEIITPRNNKLIPKVSLLKKLPSESNERGQSSNYRRIRVGRLGRKESETTEEGKAEGNCLAYNLQIYYIFLNQC